MSDPEVDSPNPAAGLTEYPVTVPLIDDQALIGEAVRRMLAGEKDVRFHFCDDPTRALQTALEVRPTVILQDLVMPEIDGLTLVKFFRANPGTRDIPMIVLSSKEEPKVKAEAFALGANDYLVKLPDRIELIARIRYHSRGYINLLQRNEAYRALQESLEKLRIEQEKSEHLLLNVLPRPIAERLKLRESALADSFAEGSILPARAWLLIWLSASHGHRLLEPTLDPAFIKRLTWQFIISNLLYVGALTIALWLPLVSLTICVGLTLLYLLPPPQPRKFST